MDTLPPHRSPEPSGSPFSLLAPKPLWFPALTCLTHTANCLTLWIPWPETTLFKSVKHDGRTPTGGKHGRGQRDGGQRRHRAVRATFTPQPMYWGLNRAQSPTLEPPDLRRRQESTFLASPPVTLVLLVHGPHFRTTGCVPRAWISVIHHLLDTCESIPSISLITIPAKAWPTGRSGKPRREGIGLHF